VPAYGDALEKESLTGVIPQLVRLAKAWGCATYRPWPILDGSASCDWMNALALRRSADVCAHISHLTAAGWLGKMRIAVLCQVPLFNNFVGARVWLGLQRAKTHTCSVITNSDMSVCRGRFGEGCSLLISALSARPRQLATVA